ncbi:putative enzyme related to lactoylglutathione lyase [Altererythrobacter atlanticus]|uniref:Glyoxalase-like domain protein n=1 Tax=Croceibacterium atlanticum TaxID=1267766 RepID=A0A0F7KTX8_9SPHN|nr:VOC family protein [Croceibacterium atlanticum]AKH42250.1 Glyoxalase-like domain protein [Croceibacterium atlanticum]MBB5731026.1 putative enzyme related to lactoylglutathione lyase [Croceibacterium atlanticum]
MTAPAVRLGFMKLNVPEMAPALAFWQEAFGFIVTRTFDEDSFVEHILAVPGQEEGPNLLLVQSRNGGPFSIGNSHGPVGLFCDDIEASHQKALECGAARVTGIFDAGGVLVALLKSPEGHEIELVQLPQA